MSLRTKQLRTSLRKGRTGAKIHGTAERPRVSVRVSHTGMFVQFIDDAKGVTLLSGRDNKETGTKTERATALGKKLAQDAKAKGITTVIFDRGARQYHGRVRALAEQLREGGLAL